VTPPAAADAPRYRPGDLVLAEGLLDAAGEPQQVLRVGRCPKAGWMYALSGCPYRRTGVNFYWFERRLRPLVLH
jgi:hypothetical protein